MFYVFNYNQSSNWICSKRNQTIIQYYLFMFLKHDLHTEISQTLHWKEVLIVLPIIFLYSTQTHNL